MSHQKLVTINQNAVTSHLRAIHPTKTAEHVAAATGIPAETVRQWLRGATGPSGPAMATLIGVYGLELLAAALPNAPGWVQRALIAERRRAAMEDMRRLGERLRMMNDEPTQRRDASGVGRVVGAAVLDDPGAAEDGWLDEARG